MGLLGRGLEAGLGGQSIGFVGSLPGELGFGAAKVPICRGLLVDGPGADQDGILQVYIPVKYREAHIWKITFQLEVQ